MISDAETSTFYHLLDGFTGSSPIFPLPDFVLFPKTGHSFHIFEQRYKEMIKDALASDRFITLALLKEGWKDDYEGDPDFYNIGTLAYIFKAKEQSNGDYNITVMGMHKVEINEATKTHSYRRGAMTIQSEIVHWGSETADREELERLFTRFLNLSDSEADLDQFVNPLINPEMLTNLICAVMPIASVEQQKMLELPDVGLRNDILRRFIEKEIAAETKYDVLKPVFPLPPDWN